MKPSLRYLLFLTVLLAGCGVGKDQVSSEDLRNATTIVLVRHAERADDGTDNPGLTPLGRARAQRLAAMLAPTGVNAVFSTPYKRTRLTAQPLAEQESLKITEYDPRDAAFSQKLLEQNAGKTLLVVGHSNTVPHLVNELTGNTNYGQLEEMEYDKIFVVNVVNGVGRAMVFSF